MPSSPVLAGQPAGSMNPPRLTAPFFEIGPKNLLRLPELLDVAVAADAAGRRHRVAVILTVPTPLIAPVRSAVPDVLVFAQGMADDLPGPSVGRVIAESLVDAGAHGVMLNHDSHPLQPAVLERSVARAHANGLMTVVCAGSESEVLDLVRLRPTVILFEPPELIGSASGSDRPWIRGIDRRVASIAPEVLMMHAGGVATPSDAYRIMREGAAGTGSTSGVLQARDPVRAVGQFVEAARAGFDGAAEPGR